MIFKLKHLVPFLITKVFSQLYFPADPYHLLEFEKKQFESKIPITSNIFKPYPLYENDSLKFSLTYRSEFYLNDNSPNQENMDIRYFSKGISNFNSIRLSFTSKYLYSIFEPYTKYEKFYDTKDVKRYGTFTNLNDNSLETSSIRDNSLRNFLLFFHYKGLGIGVQRVNRWWGPGHHSSLQMTTNTVPMLSQIIGTLKEIKYKNFGLMVFYSFSKFDDHNNQIDKFYTSLNGQLTWYGPVLISSGFSRNYLSGGMKSLDGRIWKAEDAKMLVFEGFLTSNLIGNEYTVGGHDYWDQTISGYLSISLPDRSFKIYAEVGFNDNRMYFADLLSQPDHTMATVIGFRDYGSKRLKNWIYGFEWTNLMISYTIRHREAYGTPAWYNRDLYNYSSYNNRRWSAHSGSDSDDWYFYVGYLSDKFVFIPSFNYERHGIVSNRPAEVKLELNFDIRYKIMKTWFSIKYEKQYEAFLGFPDYFYEDKFGNPIDSSSGILANNRKTNTLIFSFYKYINF